MRPQESCAERAMFRARSLVLILFHLLPADVSDVNDVSNLLAHLDCLEKVAETYW